MQLDFDVAPVMVAVLGAIRLVPLPVLGLEDLGKLPDEFLDGGVTENWCWMAGGMLGCLFLIWFADVLGTLSPRASQYPRALRVDPPWLVSLVGWCLLIGVPALILFWRWYFPE